MSELPFGPEGDEPHQPMGTPEPSPPDEVGFDVAAIVPDDLSDPRWQQQAAGEFDVPLPSTTLGEDEIELELHHGTDVLDGDQAALANDVLGLRDWNRLTEGQGDDFLMADLIGEDGLKELFHTSRESGDLLAAGRALVLFTDFTDDLSFAREVGDEGIEQLRDAADAVEDFTLGGGLLWIVWRTDPAKHQQNIRRVIFGREIAEAPNADELIAQRIREIDARIAAENADANPDHPWHDAGDGENPEPEPPVLTPR